MEFEDFFLMRKGWINKLRHEEAIARRSTALIVEGFVGKGNGIKFVMGAWPFEDDKPNVKMVKYKGVDMTLKQKDKLIRLRNKNSKQNG
jgi:hypothetical protein